MNSFIEIFEEMSRRLDITDVARENWINPIKPVKYERGTFTLEVVKPLVRDVLADTYAKLFETKLEEVIGFPVKVEIVCSEETGVSDNSAGGVISSGNGHSDPQVGNGDIYDADNGIKRGGYCYTFETFIEGDSNRLAFRAAKSVSQGVSSQQNPLYIYSEPGLGKTHLLHAIKSEAQKLRPGDTVIMTQADLFVQQFVQSLDTHTTDEFKKRFADSDLLLIDDIQVLAGKKESQAVMFYVFNQLYENGKQIVLTSDRPPKDINDIEQRLKSRFEWGLMADIDYPNYETRVAIIKRKAEWLDMSLSNTIIDFIAQKLKTNIRTIEGVVQKIHALTSISDLQATLAMAQNAIKEVQQEQPATPVTVDKIMADVGDTYKVSINEMRSKSRSASVSIARQTSMYILHKITGMPYTEIGKQFGGRDHSTIVYTISTVKSNMKKDAAYQNTVEELIKNISSSAANTQTVTE